MKKYSIDNVRPTIRFSEQAWLIIQEDRENFSHGEPLSTFLNTIFCNFYEEADCSLSTRLQKLTDKFDTIKSDLEVDDWEYKKSDKTSVNRFITAYLNDYEDELREKMVTVESENEHSEKIRLDADNQETLGELQAEDSCYEEDKFVKQYLKALFEEYARLPAYRREQIYFKAKYDTIKNAIREHRQVKLYLAPRFDGTTQKTYQRVFHVAPYKVLQDPANLYNYIIGYAQESKNGTLLEGRPASFRLSRIDGDVKTLAGSSALTQKKKALIEKKIRENGVQFLASDVIEVLVRFDQEGLENLKRQIYMRPLNREKFDDECETYTTYSFVCTEVQAINYFFKFGKHAYIVEPIELREKFEKLYSEASNLYESEREKEKAKKEEEE